MKIIGFKNKNVLQNDEIWSSITSVLLKLLTWNFYQMLPMVRSVDGQKLVNIAQKFTFASTNHSV